jgi:serine/threonine protein kinase
MEDAAHHEQLRVLRAAAASAREAVAALRTAAATKYAELVEDVGLPPRTEAAVLVLLDAIQDAGGELPAGIEPAFAHTPPFLAKFGAAWRAAYDRELAAEAAEKRMAPRAARAHETANAKLLRNLRNTSRGGGAVGAYGTGGAIGASGTSGASSAVASGAAAAPHAHASAHAWSAFVPDKVHAPLKGGAGMGHKARWTSCDLNVAVKVLHAATLSPAEYKEAVANLELEAELMCIASMHGANRFIVPQLGLVRGAPTDAWLEHLGSSITEHSVAGGELIGLAMAWEDGGALEHRLHGPAPWHATTPERLLLLERVAEGVALLHDNEPKLVIHGDLKAANVLLTADGEPRLSEFGLSVSRAAGSQGGRALVQTKSEHAAGTFAYMAPEMYRNGDAAALTASPATDVYALGTLAWEVLVGKKPWADYTPENRVRELCAGKLLDFARLPADSPSGLRALLERCVSTDIQKRPRAREVRDKIRELRPTLPLNPFVNYYSHGPGVALLFAGDEARFSSERAELEAALKRRDFEVVLLPAEDIIARLRRELDRVVTKASLRRVIFGFSGHGCTTSVHPLGLLQDSRKTFCRVAEVEDVLARAFPARGDMAVPKLLVLDCCFSNVEVEAPPAWIIDPRPENTPHDIAILGAASKGKHAYSTSDGSFSFSHALAEAINNDELLDLKDVQRFVAERLVLQGGEYADLQPTFDESKLNSRFSFHAPRYSAAAIYTDDEVAAACEELKKQDIALERAVTLLRDFAGYYEVGVAAADAISVRIKKSSDKDALWAPGEVAKAAEALVALASTQAVCDNADGARRVAAALNNIALSAEGNAACVAYLAPAALVKLAGTLAVHQSAGAAKVISMALYNISSSNDGRVACATTEARTALAALAAEPKVSISAADAEWVRKALVRMQAGAAAAPPAAPAATVTSSSTATPSTAAEAAPAPPAIAAAAGGGAKAAGSARVFTAAGAALDGAASSHSAADKASALAELGAASTAPARAVALMHIFADDLAVGLAAAIAIKVAARSAEGRAACVAAGAAAPLSALAHVPAVQANAASTQHVAAAFANISTCSAGAGACAAAGAALALVALSSSPSVRGSAGAAEHVANALANIAGTSEGLAACVAAGAAPALVALSSAPAVNGSAAAAMWAAKALTVLLPVSKDVYTAASARAALAVLAAAPAIKDNIDAIEWVGEALMRV